MKKKALVVIILYISLSIFTSIDLANAIGLEYVPEAMQLVIKESEKTQNPDLPNQINDLISPSYTNLLSSEDDPIVEGTDVTLTSTTISTGYPVSSGSIDFKDLKIYHVDNDVTSDVIYSNKFAVRVNLPQDLIIYGFIVDITPTIREDIDFYIRSSTTGADIRSGTISGYIANNAHITGQLLHVPFEYSGGAAPLTLDALNSYYFLLEPTVSTSDTFFELTESSDVPNNVRVYEWWNTYYAEVMTDVNFYLITDINTIAGDISLNSSGQASTVWTASNQGNHSLLAWYNRTIFYSESFGSVLRSVVHATETLLVSVDPITTEYMDPEILQATVMVDPVTPAPDRTVTFLASEDLLSWTTIGSAVTDGSGIATLEHQFDLEPNNYTLRAKVNEFSLADNTLIIQPEPITWNYIDFNGQFRNNPGSPTTTHFNTTIQVKDNEGLDVPNMDFELWYYLDGDYERIPHYYSTNASGMAVVDFAIDDLLAGHHVATHYFCPVDYDKSYSGNSNYGDTIIDKGILEINIQDFYAEWEDDVKLYAQALSLDEGWEGLTIRFSYYVDSQWNVISEAITNSSGYAEIIWVDMPLIAGAYLIKVEVLESSLFYAAENNANLSIDRIALLLFIINEGEARGNGEEIDLEYTSTIDILFYVTFEDLTPAANIDVEITGRLLDEMFYRSMGFVTTNGTGYAHFNNYENMTLVGYQYLFIAEIYETGEHESAHLNFKINLIKCTPIIYLNDHQGEKGSNTEIIADVKNSEGNPLRYVQLEFIIDGLTYYGTSDYYGFVRVLVAPQIAAGEYILYCSIVEDDKYNLAQANATFLLLKGMPYFTFNDSQAILDGYLTIYVIAQDSLGRPIPDLTVNVSLLGWSEVLTTNADGIIEYTFIVTGYDLGYYLLVLSFSGNDDWFDTTVTSNVLIYAQDSSIELLFTTITCTYGEEILLEAKLETIDGIPLGNRTIQFVILCENGTIILLGENFTDSNGVAQFTADMSIIPGSYDLGALYLGANDYGQSSQYTSLVIQKSQVILVGNDFNAVKDSTTTFQITLLDQFGQPIVFETVTIFIWINNTWIFLGGFTTDQNGNADASIFIPYAYGAYTLKIEFNGNSYYSSNYLNIEINVIAPPLKINPDITVDVDDLVVDHQNVTIDFIIINAINGSDITVYVYINGVFNGTFLVINGIGEFYWCPDTIGSYNITLITNEDSIYFATSEMITIEVIQNIPPELITYSFEDYICEGDPFDIEAKFNDISGVAYVWFTANGRRYDLIYDGNVHALTTYQLREGIYNIILFAEDYQGFISNYDVGQLHVFQRKTQVMKYQYNSVVIEEGQEFRLEALIYSEKTLTSVYLIINSTEYLMTLGYQIDSHKSVWYINIDSLEVGSFEIKIKLVEDSSNVYINELSEVLIVIPNTPQLNSYDWYIESNKDSDYISGNITISSYYSIDIIEVWIDGQLVTLVKIADGIYNFYGYVTHAKNHILKIRVIDVMGRELNDEITLGTPSDSPILAISLAVSIAVLIAIIVGGFFVISKYRNRNQNIDFSSEVNVPDISDELIDTFNDEPSIIDDDLEEEITAPEIDLTRQPRVIRAETACQDSSLEEEFLNPDLEPIQLDAEPQLAEVKEYIAKVKGDGLIPAENEGIVKSIDDLSSLAIEIDQRLLPEDERLKKLAEKEKEATANPTIPNLKNITEEIEQTFAE